MRASVAGTKQYEDDSSKTSGIGMSNADMKLISSGLEFYQNYFPERMRACFVVGLPTLMVGLWNLMKRLIDERTQKKIQLLYDSDTAQIFPVIPEDLVPAEVGGKHKELTHDVVLRLHEAMLKRRAEEKLKAKAMEEAARASDEEKDGGGDDEFADADEAH